jgi:hypothetical protein
MSKIHYFQRYSQKENVITNNTLLLFSRLYNESPHKFKLFLNELTNEYDINVGVNFNQQEKGKGSIPDGSIYQSSFKIAIETKLSENFSISQLTNHLHSFKSESSKVLLALSPKKIKDNIQENFKKSIINYNIENETNINFISTTFKEIVFKFREVISDYDIELHSIIDDYENFCLSVGMIRNDEYRMLTIACGATLSDNFKNKCYYDPIDRGYSHCTHLGIYNQKRVKGIGKITNIISANLIDVNKLEIVNTTNGEATSEQIENIINMINDAKNNLGWNISQNHKFFCVNEFAKTEFWKDSKGGLFGKKYFDLKAVIGKEKFKNINEIAELLKLEKW